MRKEGLREETRKAANQRRHKLDKRLSKGEKKHMRRMAQVAAVYFVDPFPRRAADVVYDLKPEPNTPRQQRPRPRDKRVWASVERDPSR